MSPSSDDQCHPYLCGKRLPPGVSSGESLAVLGPKAATGKRQGQSQDNVAEYL